MVAKCGVLQDYHGGGGVVQDYRGGDVVLQNCNGGGGVLQEYQGGGWLLHEHHGGFGVLQYHRVDFSPTGPPLLGARGAPKWLVMLIKIEDNDYPVRYHNCGRVL